MIGELLTSFDNQLWGWVSALVNILAYSWLGSGVFRTLLTLFLVAYGWAIMTGRIQSPIEESIKRLILVTVIATMLLFPYEIISVRLYPLFSEAPFGLAAMLPAAPTAFGGWAGTIQAPSIYTSLGDILESGLVTAGGLVSDGDGWVLPILHAVCILVSTIIVVGYATFLILLAKFAIALLVGLTPLFLVTLLFQTTRGMFERWLGLLINYSLVPIFALAILSFATLWMTRQLNNLIAAGADPSFADVGAYVIASCVSFLLLLQVTQLASSIGGGLALSTLGTAGAAFNVARGQVSRVTALVQQKREGRKADQRDKANAERQNSEAQYRATVSRDLSKIASHPSR